MEEIFETDLSRIGADAKLVTVKLTVSEAIIAQQINDFAYKDYVKQRLAKMLAEHLLQNDLVEFTKQTMHDTGYTSFIARSAILPKERTSSLRKRIQS